MLRAFSVLFLLVFAAGCAIKNVYNPVQSAKSEIFLLNERALQNVRVGMKQEEVHNLMGQEIIVGYDYEGSALKEGSRPKPLTIPNPYRTKNIQTSQGACTVEYYVTAVHHPDGVVSDDELMPLVFCKGILTDKGGDTSK